MRESVTVFPNYITQTFGVVSAHYAPSCAQLVTVDMTTHRVDQHAMLALLTRQDMTTADLARELAHMIKD